MTGLYGDVRYATRALWKRPGVSGVAVLSLALGIGVTTTAFSLLNAVALRDLPGVRGQDRLVNLGLTVEAPDGRTEPGIRLSWPDVEALRDRRELFAAVAAAGEVEVALGLGGEPRMETAELVSGDYFQVLGARPFAGRLLLPTDGEVGAGAVVLSYGVYEELAGGTGDDAAGDAPGVAVVGRRVEVNGRPFTVVGITEPGFTGMMPGSLVDGDRGSPGLWLSLAEAVTAGPGWTDEPLGRGARWLRPVARLADGVSKERLEAGLPAAAAAVERSAPESRRGVRLAYGPLQFGPGEGGSRVVLLIAAFMAVPLLVLLISCANAANLLLARTTERKRELAVRAALGATRGSLVRGVLLEGILLGLAAAVLGLAVALGSRQIAALYAVRLSMHAPVDLRVFGATLASAFGAGVLLGLLPALRGSAPDMAAALKGTGRATESRGESRLRRRLVVAQVALSLVLLVAAGLFVRSARHGLSVPSGLDETGLALVTFDLELLGYDSVGGQAFQERLVHEVRGLPGVRSAALADQPPLTGGPSVSVSAMGGEVEYGVSARLAYVGGAWFEAAGVRIIAGREPGEDRNGEAVVSRALAEAVGPGGAATGWSLRAGRVMRTVEVVGIAADTRSALHESPERVLYLSREEGYSPSGTLYVRADDPAAGVAAVRRLVRRLDPRLPLSRVETAQALRERELLPWRLMARGLGTMGLVALVLAVTGLYGVLSFGVARRTREIGVRMAMGAGRGEVLWMVVRESLGLVGVGLVIGGLLAGALAALLRSLLFGVSPVDPATYGTLAAGLLAVAVLAAAVPARRAAAVEPVRALAE